MAEPGSKEGLSRGMMAFKSSCAKRLNGVVARRGKVFADRYHARYLLTPAQVRAALCYVLNNWRRHGEDRWSGARVDTYSSGARFDGWKDRAARTPWWLTAEGRAPVASARFWLLTTGWRQHGAIGTREVPGPRS